MVDGLKHRSYHERLHVLNVTTLEARRARGDLIETFKLLKGKEDVDFNKFFQLQLCCYNLRGHNLATYHTVCSKCQNNSKEDFFQSLCPEELELAK